MSTLDARASGAVATEGGTCTKRQAARQTVRIVYVHGTFSQGLNVRVLHAKLVRKLRDANLRPKGEAFSWPKKKFLPFFNNTHKRRLCGMKNLRAAMDDPPRDVQLAMPGKTGSCDATFIIAHSHGSAVSLSCMKSYEDHGCPMTGVVCVSAPFISVSPIKKTLAARIWFGIIVALSCLMTAVGLGVLATYMTDANDDGTKLLWGIGASILMVALLFPINALLARRYDDQFCLKGLNKSKILLTGAAFDEAGIYTSFWTLVLNFLNWAVTIHGLAWVGLPLAVTTTWAISDSVSANSHVTGAEVAWILVGVLVASLVVRWVLSILLSFIAPNASARQIAAAQLSLPLAVFAIGFRVFVDKLNFGSTDHAQEALWFSMMVTAIIGCFGLGIMLLLNVLVSIPAATQIGVGVPFSTLLTRNVVIDKTVPDIVDRYVGFSPRNNVPIRHSRLLGWEPCQDEIVEFIYQRLVSEGFVAQKDK